MTTFHKMRLIAALSLGLGALGLSQDIITVSFTPGVSADVYVNSPSQILPVSFLNFTFAPQSLPLASAANPVIIKIRLPEGMLLSQTLATGTWNTTAPLPSAGELIVPLALSEVPWKSDVSEDPAAAEPGASPGVNAMQLFRYVAGESEIWLRLNESPTTWPNTGGRRFQCTIFRAGGVWPIEATNNWGEAGLYQQQGTLLAVDVREVDFPEIYNQIVLYFTAYSQQTQDQIPVGFNPGAALVMDIRQLLSEQFPPACYLGGAVNDLAIADLDKDGYEDLCTVDTVHGRIYWSFGSPDGLFGHTDWIETPTFRPVACDLADVSGDDWPDFLISDDQGGFHVLLWADVFSGAWKSGQAALPSYSVQLGGTPADSRVHDMNGDGRTDYLYVDKTANSFHILFGNAFNSQATVPVGQSPQSLSVGDFDGDHVPDVAVCNTSASTVSVLMNDGGGQFGETVLPAGALNPVDVETADFNRDGRSDLAVAVSEGKQLVAWKARPDGTFDPSNPQRISFQYKPSALLAENLDAENGPDVLLGFSNYHKLAICTSDASGNLAYAYNLNTLADVVVDPAGGVLLAEDGVVSVGGGTSYGGVNSQSGLAAISQQQFQLIHFPRSQELSFSVVNLDRYSPALLNLELYDNAGTYKSSSVQSVPPLGQFPRYLTDLLGTEAAKPNRWVRGFCTQPNSYGLWLANNGIDLTYLDGLQTPTIQAAATELVCPVIEADAGEFTEVFILNPYQDQAHVQVKLMSGTGDLKAVHTALLNGRGRSRVIVGDIFDKSATSADYIVIQSDREVIAAEIFGDATKLAALDPLRPGVAQGTLYSPHVAIGDFGGIVYYSEITLVNTSSAVIDCELTLRSDDGFLVGYYPSYKVYGNDKKVRDLGDLMNLTAPTSGYLEINTRGGAGLVGCITFGEMGAGRFLATLPLQHERHDHYLLGHLANGTMGTIPYFTGIAILNPNPDSRVVRLRAYDQAGALLQSVDIVLQANQRKVFQLSQVMTDVPVIFGGYLIIENLAQQNGLLVFELFGEYGFNFLSAVPAIPIPQP